MDERAADPSPEAIAGVLVDVGALIVPGRYRRIDAVARRHGWDRAVLLDHAVGQVVLPPEPGFAQHPDPDGARARADRGEASWGDAMRALAEAVDAAGGPPWDEQAYWASLTQMPAPADLGPVLQALATCQGPVGLLATGPAEFADAIDERVAGARHPIWHTCRLGVGKPDAWAEVIDRIGLSHADPSTILVIDDAWGSQQAMREAGYATMWLDGDDAFDTVRQFVRRWCAATG